MRAKIIEKKKKVLVLLVLFLVLTGAGVGAFFVWKNQQDSQEAALPQLEGMDENIVSASGLTSVGMLEETWELDFLETAIYVEESYLSTGDEVEAGTVVFQVSEETLEEARRELTQALEAAELAYRQGLLDYETGVMEAETTYNTASIYADYAQAEYDSAAASATRKVKELEAQIEEAETLVEEYTKSINEDYYRTYYKIDELYENYYDHFNLLMKYYEEWNIEEKLESTDKQSVYESLDELVTSEGKAYETALDNYETAQKTAKAGLAQASSNLASLQAELTQAQTEAEKSLITVKAEYETTLAESENAQLVYETTMESLEETLASLEDDKEEAQENLTLFEETIGDGCFYTKNAGTIVMNGVRDDSYLSGETLVIAYSNPETVTVSASVDQSSIAEISIGDSAYVVVSEYGNYQGTVVEINPVTQSESRSSVNYQVSVALEGDLSGLESNLTAYVYFGVTEKMMQSERGERQDREGNQEGETSEGAESREGMEMPEHGQHPSGEEGGAEEWNE